MDLPPTLNKKNRELPCSLPLSLLFYFLLGFQRNPSLPPFNSRATTALGGRRYTKMGSFSSPIFYLLEASSKNGKTRIFIKNKRNIKEARKQKTKINRTKSEINLLCVEVVENEGRETWTKTWSGVYGDPVWSADVWVEFVVC
ncbi:hypothetical protein ES332_A06G190800v1 [Gossypium tomentosum]|uniref:Uncharacterized protein n=1 Tax=Gossypium tomentosum TaxID=34277 RepID=A0A5D2Q6D7_GOSTO|nr:hypothetical protein ES332_A06G190800v1 [Gossypium tomentosum]